MLTNVIQFINYHKLIESGSTLVVGLSGGPDSVCLLHLLHSLKDQYALKLIAAHIDHEWRVSSKDDALFCKAFASSLNIPFVQTKASESPITKKNGSCEDLGRRIRRAFFEKVAQESGAQAIALAHHAQDQQETFFMRMLRGASISGLSSMRPHQGLYIRPLLKISKDEIFRYLKDHKLSFCIDSTNEQDSYLRNALRLHVIPSLKRCDNRFDKNFDTTLAHIQETELFLERLTLEAFKRVSHTDNERLKLDRTLFFKEDPFLYHRLILVWLCREKVPFTPSTALFDEILRFMKNNATQHHLTSSWLLAKKKDLLWINKIELPF